MSEQRARLKPFRGLFSRLPRLPPRVCFVDDRRPCCGADRPLGWAARVVGGERPLPPLPPLCACRPLRCGRVTVPMTYAHVFAASDWCWLHCLRLCVRARAQCARMLRIRAPPSICAVENNPRPRTGWAVTSCFCETSLTRRGELPTGREPPLDGERRYYRASRHPHRRRDPL